MNEPLDPLSKELLDAARPGHEPPGGSRDRVRARVVARVGATAFASSALATASTAWIKVVAPLAVLTFGGSAYFYAKRAPEAPRAPVVATTAIKEAPPVATPEPQPIVTPVETTGPVVTATPPKPTAPPPSIKDETDLLMSAQTALREGDAARALALLDDHARRFPRGALAEERGAARILALCASNRVDDARKDGAAFVAAHPKSPALARIRTSCAFSITDRSPSNH